MPTNTLAFPTPASLGSLDHYIQAVNRFPLLTAEQETELGRRLEDGRHVISDAARIEGRVVAPALVGEGSTIAAGAIVGGRVVLGPGVSIGEGAHIESSVVLEGAAIGAHTRISGSIVGPRAIVGERCRLEHHVVLGEGVQLGAGNVLRDGARVFPGVRLPDAAIRF